MAEVALRADATVNFVEEGLQGRLVVQESGEDTRISSVQAMEELSVSATGEMNEERTERVGGDSHCQKLFSVVETGFFECGFEEAEW